nr:membrane cofactor protein-like isoform X3 [Pelodiscus sinensis]|eukprot:XP_025034333.1 membrane cofactor protein-like isoform X3 [Pelodiscus sinensis]
MRMGAARLSVHTSCDCGLPPRFSFAEPPKELNDSYPLRASLKYSCRPGYTFSEGKSPWVTCLENSTWSADTDFCVGKRCVALEIENGRVDVTDIQFGATANFSCDPGHRLIGPNSVKCVLLLDGTVDWDKRSPICQAIPCVPPPDIANGSYAPLNEEYAYGSAVTYSCNKDFSLIGERSIHCTTNDQVNGEWSRLAPECKVVKCLEPIIENGEKQSGFDFKYSYGHTVIFECHLGFTLHGNSSVKCEANSSWVPSLPTCVRIAQTTPTPSSPEGTKYTSESTTKPTQETPKNATGSTTKPTQETTKHSTGMNTGTIIAIGVVGILVAVGIAAIGTYKACFEKKGKDVCHPGSADYLHLAVNTIAEDNGKIEKLHISALHFLDSSHCRPSSPPPLPQ